ICEIAGPTVTFCSWSFLTTPSLRKVKPTRGPARLKVAGGGGACMPDWAWAGAATASRNKATTTFRITDLLCVNVAVAGREVLRWRLKNPETSGASALLGGARLDAHQRPGPQIGCRVRPNQRLHRQDPQRIVADVGREGLLDHAGRVGGTSGEDHVGSTT